MSVISAVTLWPGWASPSCLLRDAYVFPAFQILLGLLFLYALSKDLRLTQRIRRWWRKLTARWRRPRGGVRVSDSSTLSALRGPESRQSFHLAYGLVSVVVLQLINTTEALQGYKTIVSILDLGVVVYLSYFSSWMRNKIVGWVGAWQRRPD